jgi:hypothetical protein
MVASYMKELGCVEGTPEMGVCTPIGQEVGATGATDIEGDPRASNVVEFNYSISQEVRE